MRPRLTLTVEKMAGGALGLARLEGRVVFLPGVLPGEEVLVEIIETRADYLRARPLEILRPHKGRVEPVCLLFLTCGGCQLMHADYSLQPGLKAQAVLADLAREYGAGLTIKPSPQPLFYRTRVRLQLARINERLSLGFFASRSKNLIPIDFCPQLHPRLNESLAALAEWAALIPRSENEPTEIEVLTGGVSEPLGLVLDLPGRPSPQQKEIITAGPGLPDGARVFYSIRGHLETQGRLTPKQGITWLEIEEPNIRLLALPGVFTQVNPEVNRLLAADVLSMARRLRPGRVLDLYSGLGNFSLPLAGSSGSVTAVEQNPRAAANARMNLRLNQVRNVNLIRGDAVRAARELAGRGERFDLIVLDPPRSGARGLAPVAARLEPEEILYVSCHPVAMTRDLAELGSLGFKPMSLTAYDMFPQTAHLEVLARLRRG